MPGSFALPVGLGVSASWLTGFCRWQSGAQVRRLNISSFIPDPSSTEHWLKVIIQSNSERPPFFLSFLLSNESGACPSTGFPPVWSQRRFVSACPRRIHTVSAAVRVVGDGGSLGLPPFQVGHAIRLATINNSLLVLGVCFHSFHPVDPLDAYTTQNGYWTSAGSAPLSLF